MALEHIEEVPTTMLSAERCHLGEGPTYDATTDTAWWFDIPERRLLGGGCVDVYDTSGRRLRSLRVGARQSSCPAFVGRDLSRLLVTTAWQGMDESARARDPEHGRTFILDANARGRAEPDVKLAG